MLLTFVLVAFIMDVTLAKSRVDTADTPSTVLQNHPRIMENCLEQFEGAEGAHIKGFSVQKVLIITSSGLQTSHVHNSQAPLQDPDDHLHFCSFEKMKQNVDIIGYLDILTMKGKFHNKKIKQDFKNLEPVPNAKHCGKHSLSSFGVLQLINLGKYLFKSYFGKLKSLDVMFRSREFASTFGDQTLFQSLSALLYGLLNEKQFVQTHIDKMSLDFSTASQVKKEQHNLNYFVEQSFLKESHLFKDTRVFAFNTRNISDKLAGADVSSKDIISYLSNSLCPRPQSYGETLGISYDDVSHIFNLSDSYNSYLTTSSLFWSYSAVRTLSLRKLVKTWLSPNHKLHNNSSNDDLKIITVDDLFMFSILRTLNVPVSRHTSPASRLIVESFVLQDSDSLNPGLEQLRENVTLIKQEGIGMPSNLHLKSILQNQLNILGNGISDNITLHDSLKIEDLSLEETHQGDLSALSTNKGPTFSTYSRDEKYDNFKLPNNRTARTYIRLLYNGQVISSFIPGCNSDEIITLGVCSFEIFEHFLNSIQ